jgi:hypothetical protein
MHIMNHDNRRRWPAGTSLGVGLVVLGLLPILGACYPYDRESTSDYDVIATTFDPNAVFPDQNTYSMPDVIVEVTDPTTPPDQADRINATVEAAILGAIADNMADLGYTRVPNNPDGTAPSGVDVQITPFAAETTWVGGSCYPYYYDWYYGGYGWCYPVYYSYTTGSVIVPMIDPDPALPPNSEPLWIAGINGIVGTDTPSATASRARNAINAAFSQSPYLDTR